MFSCQVLVLFVPSMEVFSYDLEPEWPLFTSFAYKQIDASTTQCRHKNQLFCSLGIWKSVKLLIFLKDMYSKLFVIFVLFR